MKENKFLFVLLIIFVFVGAMKCCEKLTNEPEVKATEFVKYEPYHFNETKENKQTSNVETLEMVYKLNEEYVVTAYCACSKCCGKENGITASGVKATEGVTVAADTNKLPFGTRVYIEGVGERIVQDRGGAIKGNRIDLYFGDHQSALDFGRQTKKIAILN